MINNINLVSNSVKKKMSEMMFKFIDLTGESLMDIGKIFDKRESTLEYMENLDKLLLSKRNLFTNDDEFTIWYKLLNFISRIYLSLSQSDKDSYHLIMLNIIDDTIFNNHFFSHLIAFYKNYVKIMENPKFNLIIIQNSLNTLLKNKR